MRSRTGMCAAAAIGSGRVDKQSADKLDAYWTLYECLVTTAKLIAPFTPFLAETHVAEPGGSASWAICGAAKVCICATTRRATQRDRRDFIGADGAVRHIASLGRHARMGADLKVRQPLAKVEVILADPTHQAWLEEHAGVIADELNVK